jgi:sarcosine dehydrogenase
MSLPERARIVVVGGGAIGISVCYHLAKGGETDVLLLEKSQLTEGSTWHAAGLVGQLRSQKNLTKLMRNSVEILSRLEAESGQATDFKQVGSLRLACSEERWLETKRQATVGKTFGLDMELISPDEAKKLFPYISTDGVVGAAYIPTDGYVDPYSMTHAFAKAARNLGATIIENTEVTGVKTVNNRITGIETADGDIECEIIVNCAGMWAREFAAMAGVHIPAGVVEHQFLVTEKTGNMDPSLPTLRDPDGGYYVKPEVGGFAIGGWEKATVPWATDGVPNGFGRELFPGNMDRLEEIAIPASERVPVINEIGIQTIINGPIPISPDGEPIMGPVPELENYYVAVAFTSGIAASGGAGLAMANWILEGDPGMNLWAFDSRRFGRHHTGRQYMAERSVEAYSNYYAMAWPGKELKSSRGGRRSPLYGTLKRQNCVFGSKFGWERPNWFAPAGADPVEAPSYTRPNWFDAVGEEHFGIRNGVALIDQSSFSKFEIEGPGSLGFLQYMADSNLDKPVGSATYTQLLNAHGGIEADLTIMRTTADKFYMVTGSASGIHDVHHLKQHLPADGSVHISDVTSAKAVINLCGPLARKVLEKVSPNDVSNSGFRFMSCQEIWIGYAPVLAIRLTYVGELGWELHIPTEYAAYVYEQLQAAGQEFGIINAGYRAIDSLRLEKRYLGWGSDITPDDTPLEAGLGFCVAWNKGGFLGRDALVHQREEGVTRKLHCFSVSGDISVFGNEVFILNNELVDVTTSGNFGYSVGSNLVLGYLPSDVTEFTNIELEVMGGRHPLTHIPGCAYDSEREKILS